MKKLWNEIKTITADKTPVARYDIRKSGGYLRTYPRIAVAIGILLVCLGGIFVLDLAGHGRGNNLLIGLIAWGFAGWIFLNAVRGFSNPPTPPQD